MPWIEKHKVVRRLALLLICGLISYATWRVFGPAKVSATDEYLGLLMLFGVATGFYMQIRRVEDLSYGNSIKSLVSSRSGSRVKPRGATPIHEEGGL